MKIRKEVEIMTVKDYFIEFFLKKPEIENNDIIQEIEVFLEENFNLIILGKFDSQIVVILKNKASNSIEEIREIVKIIKNGLLKIEDSISNFRIHPFRLSLFNQELKIEEQNDDNYYFGKLIPPRTTFVNDSKPEEDKLMGKHFLYLKELLEQKILVAAGPCLDENSYGVLILKIKESIKEVEKIMSNDPSVKAKLTTCEIFKLKLLQIF